MPIIGGGSGAGGAISGVVVSGTAASGQVPVASSASLGVWAYPPAYEIGYDQITTSVNVVGTTQASPTTIITCAAHTFDGGPVICSFLSGQVALSTAAASTMGIDFWEGATNLGELAFIRTDLTTSQDYKAVFAQFRFTPSAGSHTYLLQAYTSSTTGTPFIGAGAATAGALVPAFIRFTKV